MNLKFFCPRWGSDHLDWDTFLKNVKQAGYDGIEYGIPNETTHEELREVWNKLEKYGLEVIPQHYGTYDADFAAHYKSFAAWLQLVKPFKALKIDSQTGKDFFTFEQNKQLIDLTVKHTESTGVPVYHETHRNKFTFAAHITKDYLTRIPDLKITLDISHWINVAESFLEDQQEATDLALLRTEHIHARIGYPEGPQVTDPQAPEWKEAVDKHLAWWDKIAERKRAEGNDAVLTITPEFGPYPYMVPLPFTQKPITDQWKANKYMMDLLRERYSGGKRAETDDYGLSPEKLIKRIPAPAVDYLPRKPLKYHPKIGIIGTGGISDFHLKNYKTFGLDVAAIADRTLSKAERKREQFFPEADVYDDYKQLLLRKDIEVVDITPHPKDRLQIIKDALNAGKHVLSQKPFVLDINDGKELVELAKANGVKLAVNQNGRWAPHFSYMRTAVNNGLIGRPLSVDFSLQWDQTWITGNPAFEGIPHMVLFDFAIHWFDIAAAFMNGQKPLSVYASAVRYNEQMYTPPALGAVIIKYEEAQVSMAFNAHTRLGEEDVTTIVGTKGTLRSRGPGLNNQPFMELFTEDGEVKVPLEGSWFENGFQGTMGELLCAIKENREPVNSAENNLKSLELCFAALASADRNEIIVPGSVTGIK